MKETGLTLKEALESGRDFKRHEDPMWCVSREIHGGSSFMVKNILANDWMIKPKVFKLTEDQIRDAWRMHVYPIMGLPSLEEKRIFERFLSDLKVSGA